MVDIDYICEHYFNGIKEKELSKFVETTPKGNVIKGYICRKPNKYLGSCLITHVNDEENYQFVQSMPKIHYFKDPRDIGSGVISNCYEKLDGTCLILYPLFDKNGDMLEIIPKTRGRAVADNQFIKLFRKVDQLPILQYYSENKGILIFELYGILNQHEIIHYNTGIDIRLIAIYEDGKFYNNSVKATIYNFNKPDLLFKLTNDGDEWIVKVTSDKFKAYLGRQIITYSSNHEAVAGIQTLLEELNNDYIKLNGIRAVEGVVINTYNAAGHPKWFKCKPKDIEMEHRSNSSGIPKSSIRKECLKYFDEYGSRVQEIYLKDKNHHTEYITRMLSEEYSPELINKSRKSIEKIFMQTWDARIPPVSINNLCDELINNNPGVEVKDLMRIFAKEHPSKKDKSRLVFTTLKQKLEAMK